MGENKAGVIGNTMLIGFDMRNEFIRAGIVEGPLGDMSEAGMLVDLTKKYYAPSQQEKELFSKKIKAVVHHEIGHIQTNDSKNSMMLSVGVSLMSLIFFFKLVKHIKSFKLKMATLLIGSIPFSFFNQALLMKDSYYRESRADERIPDEYLEDVVVLFESFLEEEKSIQQSHNNNFLTTLLTSHPSTEDRLARFKQRLKNLEKIDKKF